MTAFEIIEIQINFLILTQNFKAGGIGELEAMFLLHGVATSSSKEIPTFLCQFYGKLILAYASFKLWEASNNGVS